MDQSRRRFLKFYGAFAFSAVATPAWSGPNLLDLHGTYKFEPIQFFIARDAFRLGAKIGGRTLSVVGLNFMEYFMGVVEHDIPEVKASTWTLQFSAADDWVMTASNLTSEIDQHFLAHIHLIMELGESGPSHLNGQSNLAYMRSAVDDRIWAVHWTVNSANEWNIGAVFVPHPHLDWPAGSRLVNAAIVKREASCRAGIQCK